MNAWLASTCGAIKKNPAVNTCRPLNLVARDGDECLLVQIIYFFIVLKTVKSHPLVLHVFLVKKKCGDELEIHIIFFPDF